MEAKNILIEELKAFAEICKESRQGEFYAQMIKDAKPIKVVPLAEVFTAREIEHIKNIVHPQAKECYKNAALVAWLLPQAKYVEGKMTCCKSLGIEHAFNKVGDKYVDVTMELALNRVPDEEEYISLGEWEGGEILDAFEKTGCYGDMYAISLRNKLSTKL